MSMLILIVSVAKMMMSRAYWPAPATRCRPEKQPQLWHPWVANFPISPAQKRLVAQKEATALMSIKYRWDSFLMPAYRAPDQVDPGIQNLFKFLKDS